MIPPRNETQDFEPGEQTDTTEVGECGGCDNYNVLNRQQSQCDQCLTTTGRGVAMDVTSIEAVGGGYRTLEVEGSGHSSPGPEKSPYHVLEPQANKEAADLSTNETLV